MYADYIHDTEPAHLGFVFGDVKQGQAELHPIDWPTFFAMFHLNGLVLAYDDDREFELLKVEGNKDSERFEGKRVSS